MLCCEGALLLLNTETWQPHEIPLPDPCLITAIFANATSTILATETGSLYSLPFECNSPITIRSGTQVPSVPCALAVDSNYVYVFNETGSQYVV